MPTPVEHWTLTRIRHLLAGAGIRPRRSYGQNFMVDANMMACLADLAGLDPSCAVIEVGVGLGNLTALLASRAGRVVGFEVDRRLLALHPVTLAGLDNVDVVAGDVMRQDLGEVIRRLRAEGFLKILVVSNLPYGITTPFVLTVLRGHPEIGRLVLTIQREVAQRFAARPGSGDYGFSTVAARLHSRFEIARTIDRNCFFPPPAVTSALVVFDRVPCRLPPPQEAKVLGVAKILFTERRKTIKTVLSRRGLAPQCWPVDSGRRAETLSLEELVDLGLSVPDFAPPDSQEPLSS